MTDGIAEAMREAILQGLPEAGREAIPEAMREAISEAIAEALHEAFAEAFKAAMNAAMKAAMRTPFWFGFSTGLGTRLPAFDLTDLGHNPKYREDFGYVLRRRSCSSPCRRPMDD